MGHALQSCPTLTPFHADGVLRGKKLINLKEIANNALAKCEQKYVVVMSSCNQGRHLELKKSPLTGGGTGKGRAGQWARGCVNCTTTWHGGLKGRSCW